MTTEGMFDSLNENKYTLDFLIGDSAEDLRNQIASIPLRVKIITIYAYGTRHIAWIQTEAKLKKVKKVK